MQDMDEDKVLATQARRLVDRHATVILTALGAYVARMEEAQREAQKAYDAVKDDAQARARQDDSLVTVDGLAQMAVAFKESAERADTAREALVSYAENAGLDF